MSEDLATWLLEQIAVDEDLAGMAFAEHNKAEAEWSEIWSGAVDLGGGEDLLITNDSGVSRHIVNFHPARVLAECDAKRRIVELHAIDTRPETQLFTDASGSAAGIRETGRLLYSCAVCDDNSEGAPDWRSDGACQTLRLLALHYASRPGYRPEWRPDAAESST